MIRGENKKILKNISKEKHASILKRKISKTKTETRDRMSAYGTMRKM